MTERKYLVTVTREIENTFEIDADSVEEAMRLVLSQVSYANLIDTTYGSERISSAYENKDT
jgi:hypothetical protein